MDPIYMFSAFIWMGICTLSFAYTILACCKLVVPHHPVTIHICTITPVKPLIIPSASLELFSFFLNTFPVLHPCPIAFS